MAGTSTEICNIALLRVRAEEIGDINEQTVGAEKCRVFYPHARDFMLTAAHWQFAKTTRALSLKSTELDQWDYCYDYPNDCLDIDYVVPPGVNGTIVENGLALSHTGIDPIEFEVLTGDNGSRYIGCNHENAVLAYTKAVTDVRLFDPLFVDLVAWRLAIDLAIPLGGDSGKAYRKEAQDEYKVSFSMALTKDANERYPRLKQREPREIQARRGNINERTVYRRY